MAIKFEVLGHVDVDSGLLMIGDPCYFEDEKWGEKHYSAMCDDLFEDHMNSKTHVSLPHERGHAGKGVAFGTAWGDGGYPVIGVWDYEGEQWESNRPSQVFVDTNPVYDENDEYVLPRWVRRD